MNQPVYQKRDAKVYHRPKMLEGSALIVNEVPLTIFLNDRELATLVCSPGSYRELAAGFLVSEGLAVKPSDIEEITCHETEGLIWVKTARPVPQAENFLRRQIASCCGKGRPLLYHVNDASQLQPLRSDCRFAASHLLSLIDLLNQHSATFRLTGGVHSAAIAGSAGLLAVYEDIGRHNALDKVLGHVFLSGMAAKDKCLLLSGRISSEILIKAARIGAPLLVSRSAPTLLAVDLADQLGITVVGFARGDRLNVYSHSDRVTS